MVKSINSILFLAINFKDWVCSTLYYEQEAIKNRMVSSVFYGPGYRYNNSNINEIIREVYGNNEPAAIFCYIDERRLLGEPLSEEVINKYKLPKSLHVFPTGLKECNIAKIAWINDFWHCSKDEWDNILLGNGFSAAFATYSPPFVPHNVFTKYFSDEVRRKVIFVPWPRAASNKVFHDYNLDKIYDVTLLGAMDKSFYPLRTTMLKLLQADSRFSVFYKGHPGYRFIDDKNALTGQAYARIINQSKIFASCTGIYNLPFIKIYEVLAGNSVLLCDRPCGADELGLVDGENYIEVTADDFMLKAEQILKQPDRLLQISAAARRLFLQKHTVEVRAAEFVSTLNKLLEKVYQKMTLSVCKQPLGFSKNDIRVKHITEVAEPASDELSKIWIKYGLNVRYNEIPPVVTESPELVMLRGGYLGSLAKSINAKFFAEVGTARGFQSAVWANYLFNNNIDGLVYTCDIDSVNVRKYKTPITGDILFTRGELWEKYPESSKVVFVHGTSSELRKEINHKLDMIYIDGEHSEEAVIKDYENLKCYIKEGTILVFDDCDDRFPGVQNAVATICSILSMQPWFIEFSPSKYRIAICIVPEKNVFLESKLDSNVSRLFVGDHEVYLASADRMDKVLSNIDNIMPTRPRCDVFATVIGGLSGLNYLTCLNPLEIKFFDVNENAVKYGRLILEVIRISCSPDEFISRIFCRWLPNFLKGQSGYSLSFENQHKYLEEPISEELLKDTLSKLSAESRLAFEAFISPHLSGKTLNGVRNCRRLLPCWPIDKRVPVGGGQAEGYNEEGKLEPNTNTFFYGYGWLGSTEAYNHVKTLLSSRSVQIFVADLMHVDLVAILDLTKNCVLHISNIDDWFADAWKVRLKLWTCQVNKTAGRLKIISSHNGISNIQSDPHMRAYLAIRPHVTGRVVEVSHKVPWGFHEFERINVTAKQYLENQYPADTTILHILIGEGITQEVFTSIYKRAIAQSNKIIILEHNRLSLDWHTRERNNFVSAVELRKLLGIDSNNSLITLLDFQEVGGLVDDARNILFVVGKAESTKRNIKVLMFYDEEGWAWWYRASNIKKNISPDIEIDICKIGSHFKSVDYDYIVLFEAYLYDQIPHVPPEKVIVGSSTLKTLSSAALRYGQHNFAGFVVNNLESYKKIEHLKNVYCCQNGVDEDLFVLSPHSTEEMTACWVGNNISINNKGLDIITEACQISGVKLLALDQSKNVYIGKVITQEEVRDTIYHKSTFYICASEMEGTPNPALEALSCGLPVISTFVGNMPEIIVDGYNGFLVERSVESIVSAIIKFKNSEIDTMSRNARKSILDGWTWKIQVKKYEQMFRDIVSKSFFQSLGYQGITNNFMFASSDLPLVSVIVPTHNRPDMLATAISSILAQTMQSFEIIVVNDAGTDVRPVLERFDGRENIRHLVHETNRGLAAARNTGINAARGKYIAYLDDDDTYYPHHLETLVGFLESNDCRVAYSDANCAIQQKTDNGFVTVKKEVIYSRDFDYDAILYVNFIPVLCIIHERACLSLSGMFDDSLSRHEDWDLWIRMSRHERFAHIKTVTCEYTYRPDGSSMTSSSAPLFFETYKAVCGKYGDFAKGKPLVQERRTATMFNGAFNTFQFIGERLGPHLANCSVTAEMLRDLAPSGASFSQIKSALIWKRAVALNDGTAIPLLEIALVVDRENHPARVALCERYMRAGQYVDALKHIEYLAEVNPHEVFFAATRDTLLQTIRGASSQGTR